PQKYKNARRIGKSVGKIFPSSVPVPLCKERPELPPAVLLGAALCVRERHTRLMTTDNRI
ncbi:hypothetical protein, partial [Hominenteromicrobium sp.]|uniref:hypothetical protein n=1 Tax=Hominenteromicrobium sp. TaxID=3073581 RepID=UPI003A952D12